MNDIIIDGYTGAIITASQLRIERYHAALDDLLSPRNAPQPCGPWCELTVAERISAMQAAKHGGAYADAMTMQRLGYAVGDIGG